MEELSQLVISESAATCIANNVAKSNLGHIHLFDQTVGLLWNDPELKFTTSTLGAHFPILKKRFGENKPLYSLVKFKDINILFGSFDTDLIVSYTVCFTIKLLPSDDPKPEYRDIMEGEELIYDEVKMVTSAKVSADDDMVFITLLKHKLYIDNEYG